MRKYKIAISGWAVIEIEADTPEQAEEKLRDNPVGIAGELYNLEIYETVPETESFQHYTDLN